MINITETLFGLNRGTPIKHVVDWEKVNKIINGHKSLGEKLNAHSFEITLGVMIIGALVVYGVMQPLLH